VSVCSLAARLELLVLDKERLVFLRSIVVVSVSACLLLGAGSVASAATISTSPTPPAAGTYLPDAWNDTGATGMYLKVSDKSLPNGQSFTHGIAGGPDYHLSLVTFRAATDPRNSAAEPTTDFILRLHRGKDFAAGTTQRGPDITVTGGPFDATANRYITIELTPAETASLGALTAGQIYSVGLITPPYHANNYQFSLAGDSLNSPYPRGTGIHTGSADYQGAKDLTFYIGAPEPGTMILMAAAVPLLLKRRRRRI